MFITNYSSQDPAIHYVSWKTASEGVIVEAYCEEKYLSENKPDDRKIMSSSYNYIYTRIRLKEFDLKIFTGEANRDFFRAVRSIAGKFMRYILKD